MSLPVPEIPTMTDETVDTAAGVEGGADTVAARVYAVRAATRPADQPESRGEALVPFRFFAVRVVALRRLSPSFLRVTVGGPDLDRFADNGDDQRIKLAFPLPEHGLAHLPTGPDWYQRWRALPNDRRNPIRTYTVRVVRPSMRELDIDMVLHGPCGPASRWAAAATLGTELAVMGPDAGYPGEHGGRDFRWPARAAGRAGAATEPHTAAALLLAGDETAVPAICAILERLPEHACGEALLEVPHPDDTLPLVAPAGVTVTWLARGHEPHGSRLVAAVPAAVERLHPSTRSEPAEASGSAGSASSVEPVGEVDVDREVLWEVPNPTGSVPLYAWLAGEAGVIRTLRRHLVSERGLDRVTVAFMGYWRLGRAEDAIT